MEVLSKSNCQEKGDQIKKGNKGKTSQKGNVLLEIQLPQLTSNTQLTTVLLIL